MGTLQCDVWDRAASEDQHKLSQQQVRLITMIQKLSSGFKLIDFHNSHITGMTARANRGDVSGLPAHRHKASLDIVSSSLIVILFMCYCYCWVNLSVPCHLKACDINFLGEVIKIK